MKQTFWVSVALCSLAVSAHATPVSAPGHTCIVTQSGVSRVAAVVADPVDCCTGRMQCPQYLSTTMVVHPAPDQHT
ncbi:MAG: hypothetical protein WDN49_22615 [Acetobacteraceae bacterium]